MPDHPHTIEDTIVRVQKMYFDPPDIDGRMPRVSKWEG